MDIHVPYSRFQERKTTESLFNKVTAKKHVIMYLQGLPESGKSTIMKQVCIANGFKFPLSEKKTFRYHLLKQVVYGMCSLVDFIIAQRLAFIVENEADVKLINKFRLKHVPKSHDLKLLQLVTMPENVKQALVNLWKKDELKEAFRPCTQQGKDPINEDCRIIMDRLCDDEGFFHRFGSDEFLPEDEDALLSNGVKYTFKQSCYYLDGLNQFLHSHNVEDASTTKPEALYYARPDTRKRIIHFPLIAPKNTMLKRNNFWRVSFTEKKDKRKERLAEKDCLVYTVDVSGYDTIASKNIYGKESTDQKTIIRAALDDFKIEAARGHVVAVVFTHVDILFRKYREEGIPLDVANDFFDAPKLYDEDDGSVSLALAYFRRKFQEAFNVGIESLTGNNKTEREREIFKIFCINGLDYENIQGTLKALLEQFFGMNIPKSAMKNQ